MCIRDRADRVLLGGAHGLCDPGPGDDEQSVGERRAVSVPCLLYTSDAADERSSVDLGGRRIIKKQTSANDG